ncbi:MAG: VOC family protein [Alphaproteobacteria bacterium]|nr:VOC family protein [Alphaproteobacteria bacterium]
MAAIKTLGLDHLVLRVANVKRSITWYEAALGCTLERVLPRFGLYQLRTGRTLIDLVDIKGPVGKMGGAAAGAKRRNLDHFCVQLESFDEKRIVTYLKKKRIKPGKVERRYGALGHGPSMYLTDPDGNTVELKGPPDKDQTERLPDASYPGRKRRAR